MALSRPSVGIVNVPGIPIFTVAPNLTGKLSHVASFNLSLQGTRRQGWCGPRKSDTWPAKILPVDPGTYTGAVLCVKGLMHTNPDPGGIQPKPTRVEQKKGSLHCCIADLKLAS